MRNARDEDLRHELRGGERTRHDDELHDEAAGRVDELRQERGEKEDRLRVRDRRERALAKEGCAAPRFRALRNVDPDGRRTPYLDAEPDEIRAADPLEDCEPHQRSLQQRADPEHRQRDDRDESHASARHGVERLAPSMQRAMGQRQQAIRARARATGRSPPGDR